MRYTTKNSFTEWSQIRGYLDAFAGDWIFRGQLDASWGLDTSLDRATSLIPKQMAEHLVYRAFTRNAHNYLQAHEMPVDLLEWFALMQHHGAPTRLLDWTHSPYAACFFAVENAITKNGECAVWAVDGSWLKQQGRDVIRRHLSHDPKYQNFKTGSDIWDKDDFHAIFHEHKLPVVMPAEPYRRNQRLTIQSGLFLCPGNVNKGFQGNFGEYDQDELEKHAIKTVIPNKLRVEILTDLNYMNVNRATLFPGIDGFAQSLRQAIIDLEDHGQINRRMIKKQKYGIP